VFVDAPLDIRKERIMTRPEMTQEQMEMIMKNQDNPEDIQNKLKSANISFVTINNDGKTNVEEFVLDTISAFKYYLEN
jgi:dephospho-CoA kinase